MSLSASARFADQQTESSTREGLDSTSRLSAGCNRTAGDSSHRAVPSATTRVTQSESHNAALVTALGLPLLTAMKALTTRMTTH